MHIVYLTTEFTMDHFHCGGLANYLANMANIFEEHGHLVTIIVLNWERKLKKEIEWKKNIWIDTLDTNNCVSAIGEMALNKNSNLKLMYEFVGFINNVIIEKKLLELHNKRKIDLVQYSSEILLYKSRSWFFPSTVRICALYFFFRSAYRPEFNFDKAIEERDERENQQLRGFKRAYSLIGPGRLTGQVTYDLTGRKVRIIESPFYASTDNWNYDLYQKKLKGKKYILFFGTLGYLKGTHNIASIIYDIFSQYSDVYLVLVGMVRKSDGSVDKRKEMLNRVIKNAKEYSDRVVYLGEIKKECLYPIINYAHVCLLPSRMDNLPNTCIEAMGLGKIVIGTRKASFEQLIIDGYNGFLGECDNPTSYLEAVQKVFSLDEKTREIISERAKERINEMNPERVYKRFLKHYNEVISAYYKKIRKRKIK